jgi:tetratricopeptide (TPR) repeat protein
MRKCLNIFVKLALVAAVEAIVFEAVAQSDCPGASGLLASNKPAEAFRITSECMSAAPDDTGTWFLHARALAALKRYDEALLLSDKAVALYPDDLDWRVLKIRIQAWKGELDRAWDGLERLPVRAFLDNDNLRLAADVAFWRGDCANAVWRYDELLSQLPGDPAALKNRGTCHKNGWELKKAEADFKTLCSIKPESGGDCMPLNDFRRDTNRFRLLVQPAYAVVIDRPDEWDVFGLLEVRVWEELKLGISADWRLRYYDTGPLQDTYLEGFLSWKSKSNFLLYVAGGGTVLPEFSPIWTAQIDGGYATKFGLEVHLNYTRFVYTQTGANVISPWFIYYWKSFAFMGRYYLSIDDTGKVTNAGLGKIMYFLRDLMGFYVGGAGGDHADYLDVRGFDTQYFWQVMAGLYWNVTWQHRLFFTYQFRDEVAGGEKYLQNYFITGYQFMF